MPAARRARRAAGACLVLLAAGLALAPALALEVVDDSGRTVALAHPAERIVSLAPGLTEILFDIGAGARVVAVSEFSDTPPAARALPRVSRAQGIDLEAIAALHPDLVVVWGTGYPPSLLEALRQLGVPVYVHEARRLEAIAAAVERLGVLTGSTSAAGIAADFRARLAGLRARYAGRPTVRVFYQVWANPVMTLSGRHVASEVLETCGARNVFASLAQLVATVDAEAVLAARPQLIVTGEAGAVDHGALDFWKRYPQIPAVAHGQLVTIDADEMDRQTPRVLDAAQNLCEVVERARG
jgi:iron complex transport system substrate-binding protein